MKQNYLIFKISSQGESFSERNFQAALLFEKEN